MNTKKLKQNHKYGFKSRGAATEQSERLLWHFLPQYISNISILSQHELPDGHTVTPCWVGNFSVTYVGMACISNPCRCFYPRLWNVMSLFIIIGLVSVSVWRHTGSSSIAACVLVFSSRRMRVASLCILLCV